MVVGVAVPTVERHFHAADPLLDESPSRQAPAAERRIAISAAQRFTIENHMRELTKILEETATPK